MNSKQGALYQKITQTYQDNQQGSPERTAGEDAARD